MKTTGVLWKQYLDSWPDGQWFDDSDVTINGEDDDDVQTIQDGDVVQFTAGVVFASADDKEGKSLPRHFAAWLKAQTTVAVVCEVPKEQLGAFRAAVKALGGRVKT